MVNYKRKFDELKKQAARAGRRVRDSQRLYDYAAMNPTAARILGIPNYPQKTILLSAERTLKQKCHDLEHELKEEKLLLKGYKYWIAHVKTL